MNLLKIAHVPTIQVSPQDTVIHAVEMSLPAKVGAVAVTEGGRLVGIFTERDLMYKVVHMRRDPESTLIRDVMTSPVITVPPEMAVEEVLQLMIDRHIRHLPISTNGAKSEGMLSIRNVLQFMVRDLKDDVLHMANFIGADSPGG